MYMRSRLLGWELFIETVPSSRNFLDWHLSLSENHLWLGHLHVVFNRITAVQ